MGDPKGYTVTSELPGDRPPDSDATLFGFTFDGDVPPEPPRYLVKHLLPVEGVAMLGGQSGAGKTFTAVDLAVSLAIGEPFFGRRVVERVGTLILAAEGAGTLSGRIEAARQARADGKRLPIAWMGAVPNLADPDEVKALQAKIRAVDARMQATFGVRLGLIVIDTLAAAFAMKDENDAAEAQQALRHMRSLGEPLGALVMPVHHYGKSEETGLRGSSAYRGGADAILSVLADRNQVTGEVTTRSLNLAKTRYGEEGPIAAFSLRFIQLGTDEDGDPFGACVLDPALDQPPPSTRKAPQKDPLPIVALKGAFDEVMLTHSRDVKVRGQGATVQAITVEELRTEFRRRYATGETDGEKAAATIRQALKRALTACPKHGFLTAAWDGEEWLWKA
ncbi:AAA family ATPase [Methylobacterium sp. J-030]|uniref:ATP-binding protein n=1 Tax=Methylobacterium sp. J-030 TaxID=2836627 RepID=UPI001FB93AA7|nr:AAA family ATPase [Methylobacterium sp. J-030]MCJ2069399.1 AAA family ATPase [Methylobacterium sp. J-030]